MAIQETTHEEILRKLEVNKRAFAKDSVSFKTPTTKLSKKINKKQIIQALENPYKNWDVLQSASLYLKTTNGVYYRLINHFANLATYDCMLYPADTSKKQAGEGLVKEYLEVAELIEKMNLKFNLTWFAKRLFELGELYIYKIEDKKSIIYKEMPNGVCRISSIEDNVAKYCIDLKSIGANKDIYASMPPDIQTLVDKFKDGGFNKEVLIDDNWYELEKNAYAFNLINPFLSKGYPPFSYLFLSLLHLAEIEETEFINYEADNLKIIHQELPMDDEGNLLISYEEAQLYHSSTKKNLPQGVAITTNPLKLQALTLQRAGNQSINHRANTIEAIYTASGVNMELFNGKKNSNESILTGTKADELLVHDILNLFENFVNYEISNNKKNTGFRAKMLTTSYFNQDFQQKMARENLAYGGSRLHFLATCGLTPLQSVATLDFEQRLGVDKLLVPQETSHTMSGGDVDGQNREVTKDYQDLYTKAKTN